MEESELQSSLQPVCTGFLPECFGVRAQLLPRPEPAAAAHQSSAESQPGLLERTCHPGPLEEGTPKAQPSRPYSGVGASLGACLRDDFGNVMPHSLLFACFCSQVEA